MKRISLSAYDAEHVYEWLRMYWRDDSRKFGGCYECERTGRRLERLIGPTAVRRVARVVQRNPGPVATPKTRAARSKTAAHPRNSRRSSTSRAPAATR